MSFQWTDTALSTTTILRTTTRSSWRRATSSSSWRSATTDGSSELRREPESSEPSPETTWLKSEDDSQNSKKNSKRNKSKNVSTFETFVNTDLLLWPMSKFELLTSFLHLKKRKKKAHTKFYQSHINIWRKEKRKLIQSFTHHF